jgi:hypothetical protein
MLTNFSWFGLVINVLIIAALVAVVWAAFHYAGKAIRTLITAAKAHSKRPPKVHHSA